MLKCISDILSIHSIYNSCIFYDLASDFVVHSTFWAVESYSADQEVLCFYRSQRIINGIR